MEIDLQIENEEDKEVGEQWKPKLMVWVDGSVKKSKPPDVDIEKPTQLSHLYP